LSLDKQSWQSPGLLDMEKITGWLQRKPKWLVVGIYLLTRRQIGLLAPWGKGRSYVDNSLASMFHSVFHWRKRLEVFCQANRVDL
jgi:hypothetical protein